MSALIQRTVHRTVPLLLTQTGAVTGIHGGPTRTCHPFKVYASNH